MRKHRGTAHIYTTPSPPLAPPVQVGGGTCQCPHQLFWHQYYLGNSVSSRPHHSIGHAPHTGVPVRLMARPIATPLKADAWSKAPTGHPNPEWVAALLKGMWHGLQMAFRKSDHAGPAPTTPHKHNGWWMSTARPSWRIHSWDISTIQMCPDHHYITVLQLFPRKLQASGE